MPVQAPTQHVITQVLTTLTNLTAVEIVVVSGLDYSSVSDALTRMYRRGRVVRKLDRIAKVSSHSQGTRIYRYKLTQQGTPEEVAREQRRLVRRKTAAAYRQTDERAASLRQQWTSAPLSSPEREAALEQAMRAPLEGEKAQVVARASVTLCRLLNATATAA